jgi:hypothetical protein
MCGTDAVGDDGDDGDNDDGTLCVDGVQEPDSYRRERIWMSVDNYYIRALTNRHRQDPGKPIRAEDLQVGSDNNGSILNKRIILSL